MRGGRLFIFLTYYRSARAKAELERRAGAQIALFRAIAAPRSETKNTKHLSRSLLRLRAEREREKKAQLTDNEPAPLAVRALTDGVTVENFENSVCVNLSRTAEEYVKLGDYNIQLGLEKHSDSLARSILLGEKSGDVKEQPRK